MSMGFFNDGEKEQLLSLYRRIVALLGNEVSAGTLRRVRRAVADGIGAYAPDRFGLNALLHRMRAVELLAEALSPDASISIALILAPLGKAQPLDAAVWGKDVATMVDALNRVDSIYERAASVESDNFRNLLLTFAQDIRVIIAVIVERLALMRALNHHPDHEAVKKVAAEARYLYAPLAHRLGLYAIKGELEDLSLKYSNREVFSRIAHDLNQRKESREAYIADFIAPVKEKLLAAGLKFDIKGRTKSISSIWNKIQKQHNDLDHIYDLFAIRVIIDTPADREKADCWLAYSVITDMYKPNPARMKDWISIPKSNGYESLHITVSGPQSRWVEVQIRTRRMDLVAEKGLAAHWRYKGIKGEKDLDTWMNNVRDILETADSGPLELMKNMSMDVYSDEVFVFTPRGDLHRLPKGATVLDFAFAIHTKLGCQCTGGRVNGKNRKINHRLQSGDTVEINTSQQQAPTRDWLQTAVTSKARTKIRQVLNEAENRRALLGRETLERRAKNRKLELDEPTLMRFIKKCGYKTVTDFFSALAEEQLDANRVLEQYADFAAPESTPPGDERKSAGDFVMPQEDTSMQSASSDILVIGSNNLKGMNYRMARCCNPIYGDDVFGFISSDGVVKIHRCDCPNASNIRERYPYRIIAVRWSGTADTAFPATLSVTGVDDIGIVTNISSIINKERDIQLRGIAIDSLDGLFRGSITVGVNSTAALNQLIKKIKTIKGVKNAQRIK